MSLSGWISWDYFWQECMEDEMDFERIKVRFDIVLIFYV